jgi:cis-3-alkyl-4-acyloxetan-2-one decarboxylase
MFNTVIHKHLRIPYSLNVHIDQKAKRPRATILLLHGIGNSAAAWDEIVRELPNDTRIISVDLLGFGDSPSPRWMKYDAGVQARSVAATLMRLNIRQPLTIVGHSMGALTAIEIAKRYPFIVKSLVLCSPPLYSEVQRRQLLPDPNMVLRNFYRLLVKTPAAVVTAAPLALKLKIVGKAFNVTRENVDIYMAALESSIIYQTSMQDINKLKKPMRILHGTFDPVVIKKNLDKVVKTNANAELTVVLAGHELLGAYIPAVVKAVNYVL